MDRILLIAGRLSFVSWCLLSSLIAAATADARVSEEFHQTYPLVNNGELRLDNINGKVRITTWERAEIQIDAVKRADTQADLDALKIEVAAKPDRIRIHTKYPKLKASLWRKGESGNVDYELKVPVQINLKEIQCVNAGVEIEGVSGPVNAFSVNGRLKVTGLAADSKLESINGTVEATFEKFENVNKVGLKSVNGKLELNLPSDVNADVSAKSVNGGIHADSGLTPTKHWPVGSSLQGTLGKGGSQIKLETVNGSIRVRCSQAAFHGPRHLE